MWLIILPIFLCISLSNCHGRRINNYAGPFDLEVKQMEHCPNETQKNIKFILNPVRLIRDRKSMRSWWYNGTLNCTDDLSDNHKMRVDASAWNQQGGWMPAYSFNSEQFKFCSTFKSLLHDIFVNLTNALGVPPTCPIPKGFYEVQSFYPVPDVSKIVPIFKYGKYRAEARAIDIRTSTTSLCLRIYADVKPKT